MLRRAVLAVLAVPQQDPYWGSILVRFGCHNLTYVNIIHPLTAGYFMASDFTQLCLSWATQWQYVCIYHASLVLVINSPFLMVISTRNPHFWTSRLKMCCIWQAPSHLKKEIKNDPMTSRNHCPAGTLCRGAMWWILWCVRVTSSPSRWMMTFLPLDACFQNFQKAANRLFFFV